MHSTVFIAFDTETTGLYPGFDQLVEIAACRFSNGMVIDTFQTLVNPEREIPPEITDLHGITNEMVADAPRCDEAVSAFLEYVGECPLLAHNAPFDENFVSFNCHKYGLSVPPNPIYDTLVLSRRLFPELKGHGLAYLTEIFEIEHSVKHRGMPDVLGTRGVFIECLKRLERRGVCTMREFDGWYGDPIRFSPEKFGLLVKLPAEYAPLREAIERGDKLELAYEDRSGKRTMRVIEPQGLFVSHGNLYVTAFCHLRDANRNFKLERIHAFRVVEENAACL
jgi:DNA polymerase III epsilon subunit family exonuclease